MRKARWMTVHCYPDPITVEQFVDELTGSLSVFAANMNNLKDGSMYAEEWAETLPAWMDMEKGDKTDQDEVAHMPPP